MHFQSDEKHYCEAKFVAYAGEENIAVIELMTPGYTAEDISVKILDGMLVVRAKEKTGIAKGHFCKGFRNVIPLTAAKEECRFDLSNLGKAVNLANGILRIELPVATKYQATELTVNG